MLRLFAIFISLIFYTAPVFTQSNCNLILSGSVVDTFDYDHLSFATIFLKEKNIGVATDDAGYFKIENLCPGNYTLVASHVGCESKTILLVLTSDTVIQVNMAHSDYLLNDIIIAEETPEYTGTLSSVAIDEKQLLRISGKPLGEMLKSVNGVQSLQTGTTVSKPVIQGLYGNRILIMHNEVRQEGQQWGLDHGSEIDPYIADEIIVIKGPSGIRYGSDAMGGVVLLQPAPMPSEIGTSGSISTAFFTNGLAGIISGQAEGKPATLLPLSWRLQATGKIGGNTKAPDYYLANTGFNEISTSSTLGWESEKYSAELYYSYYNSTIGIFAGSHIGNITDLERAFTSDTPLVHQDFTYSIEKPYQFLEHHLIKAKSAWNSNVGNFEAILAYQDNHRSEFDTRRGGGEAPNLYFEIGTATLDFIWQHPVKNNFNGTIGINGMNQQNITDGDIFIPNYLTYSGGIYAIEKYVLHKLSLEGGIRYDYRWLQIFKSEADSVYSPESNYENFSWQLGAIYRPNAWLRFHINSGTAWRAPSVSELYSDGLHHGAAALEYGDPNLQTEVLYGNSISTHVHLPKVHIDFDTYYNVINNYIYLQPDMPPVLTIAGAFPVFRYAQTDARLYGIDASFSYEFVQYFLAEVRTSVVRGRDITNNSWLVQMPADRISMALHYSLNNKSALYFDLKGEYTFEQTRYEEGTDYVPPPDAYTLFSAETGGILFAEKYSWEWSVAVENIFNVAYRNYMNRLHYFADEAGINILFRLKIPILN